MEELAYKKLYLFKKSTQSYRRLNLLAVIIIFISNLIVTETFYYNHLKDQPLAISNNPQKNTTHTVIATDGKSIQIKDRLSQVEKRIETLPPDQRDFISPEIKYPDRKTQKTIIRNKATVMDIIDIKEAYRLLIDSGQIILGRITTDTFIGDAWFGINESGHVFLTQYQKIDSNGLEKIKTGDKVNIAFFEEDLNSSDLNLREFILLE